MHFHRHHRAAIAVAIATTAAAITAAAAAGHGTVPVDVLSDPTTAITARAVAIAAADPAAGVYYRRIADVAVAAYGALPGSGQAALYAAVLTGGVQ